MSCKSSWLRKRFSLLYDLKILFWSHAHHKELLNYNKSLSTFSLETQPYIVHERYTEDLPNVSLIYFTQQKFHMIVVLERFYVQPMKGLL